MIERKEQGGGTSRVAAKKASSIGAATPKTRKKTPIARPKKSVSFQIRTPPDVKEFAERVAEAYETGGRSKLDAEMYKRGLLLTVLMLGPNVDGTYAGMSEQELARQLTPSFDRQYAVLDRHQMLAQYVYRVWAPGSAAYPASSSAPVPNAPLISNGYHAPGVGNEEQEHYTLGEEAQGTLDNFAEEI